MSCSTCKYEELQVHEYPCCECSWEHTEKYEPKEEDEEGAVKNEQVR